MIRNADCFADVDSAVKVRVVTNCLAAFIGTSDPRMAGQAARSEKIKLKGVFQLCQSDGWGKWVAWGDYIQGTYDQAMKVVQPFALHPLGQQPEGCVGVYSSFCSCHLSARTCPCACPDHRPARMRADL